MKQISILFTFLFIFTASPIFSQLIVDSINLNEKEDLTYIEVFFDRRLFKDGFLCNIDYGQINDDESFIKNQDGRPRYFPSRVAGLNYIYQQGWVLVAAMDEEEGSKRYIFKKKE